MDRRGRGASGDAPDYDAAREYEDVAAVVDAVARSAGSKAARTSTGCNLDQIWSRLHPVSEATADWVQS